MINAQDSKVLGEIHTISLTGGYPVEMFLCQSNTRYVFSSEVDRREIHRLRSVRDYRCHMREPNGERKCYQKENGGGKHDV